MNMNKEIKACYSKNSLPMLAEPKNVRVKFRKTGNLQYISHLDLQRTLHRIIVRAGIPVWYTKGFNPHAKIVFSTPLSIGAESECEMVDIRIDREMSCEKIKELLNDQVTDELRILDVYFPKTKFSDIVWASYEIELHGYDISQESAQKINDFVSKDTIMATKKTKSGDKETNIAKMIRQFNAEFDENCGNIKISAVLNVNGENYLNPELLLSVIFENCSIMQGKDDEKWYSIIRTSSFFEDGVTVFR